MDQITRRRVLPVTVSSNWNGVGSVTCNTPNNSGLAQHQISVGCSTIPAGGTVQVSIRPPGAGFFVPVGTINLALTGSGTLIFPGLLDAVRLSFVVALTGGVVTSSLSSVGNSFLPSDIDIDDPVSRRRMVIDAIPAWMPTAPITLSAPNHSGLAQHQIAFSGGVGNLRVLGRHAGDTVYASINASMESMSAAGSLAIFSGIYDSFQIIPVGTVTGSVVGQLASIGTSQFYGDAIFRSTGTQPGNIVIVGPGGQPILPPSGVTAGTYGDITHVGQFTVNLSGQITAAGNVAINVPLALGYTPADDANVVHKTGTETISGAKTFTLPVTASSYTMNGTGSGTGYIFFDRTSGIAAWNWYSTGGIARLFSYVSGLDKFTVDASGNTTMAGSATVNNSLTVNCATTSDAFQVNNPGTSPAGSYVYISSPTSVPGLIGNYGGLARADIKFNNGSISFAVSSNTASTTDNFTFNSAGSFAATGTITAASTVTSGQNFASSSVNVVIGTSAAGAIYLRPNGLASTTGQLQLNSSGSTVIAGALTAQSTTLGSNLLTFGGGGEWDVKGAVDDWYLFSNVNNMGFFSTANGYGFQLAKAAKAVTFFGDVATSGTITAAQNVASGQNFVSSTAAVVLGTNGAGTVYLRPNGAGSGTAQATLGSTGLFSLTSSGITTTLGITDTGASGANIRLMGNGATTPNKTLRVTGGIFQIVNSAYSAVISALTDLGAWSVNGLTPSADNTITCGNASFRWSVIYAGTGTINTSDAREKTDVAPLTTDELAASIELARAIGTYKWLSSIQDKGADARTHVGMTVQSAIKIMQSHNLDPMAYGFICHDQWDAKEAVTELSSVGNGDGQEPSDEYPDGIPETYSQVPLEVSAAIEAGDRYGFRVDELTLFIARGFDARLAAIEARQ